MTEHLHVTMLPKSALRDWKATVDGAKHQILAEGNAILLDVLRDGIGKLGVKRGCDMGTCGCCAVLIDGQPRLSCLTLAAEVKGAEITTVAGLASNHHLHPIQKTFSEYGGSQCGFCTPGFLVVISALLESNPDPSDSEIKTAIDGNLCRCTGFQPILDSVRAAAQLFRDAKLPQDTTVAKSNPHPGLADVAE
jgi:aerobic-type carbon monoxide dehydrogenase small subunit (CoxS/CutS family)